MRLLQTSLRPVNGSVDTWIELLLPVAALPANMTIDQASLNPDWRAAEREAGRVAYEQLRAVVESGSLPAILFNTTGVLSFATGYPSSVIVPSIDIFRARVVIPVRPSASALPPASVSAPGNAGAADLTIIIGAAAGGLVALIAVSAGTFIALRRKQKNRKDAPDSKFDGQNRMHSRRTGSTAADDGGYDPFEGGGSRVGGSGSNPMARSQRQVVGRGRSKDVPFDAAATNNPSYGAGSNPMARNRHGGGRDIDFEGSSGDVADTDGSNPLAKHRRKHQPGADEGAWPGTGPEGDARGSNPMAKRRNADFDMRYAGNGEGDSAAGDGANPLARHHRGRHDDLDMGYAGAGGDSGSGAGSNPLARKQRHDDYDMSLAGSGGHADGAGGANPLARSRKHQNDDLDMSMASSGADARMGAGGLNPWARGKQRHDDYDMDLAGGGAGARDGVGGQNAFARQRHADVDMSLAGGAVAALGGAIGGLNPWARNKQHHDDYDMNLAGAGADARTGIAGGSNQWARGKQRHADFDMSFAGSGADARLGIDAANPMARQRPGQDQQHAGWWPSDDAAAGRLGAVRHGGGIDDNDNPLARVRRHDDTTWFPGRSDGNEHVAGSNPLARGKEFRGGPEHTGYWDDDQLASAEGRLGTDAAHSHFESGANPLARKHAAGRSAFEPTAEGDGFDGAGAPSLSIKSGLAMITRAWTSRRSRLAGMKPTNEGDEGFGFDAHSDGAAHGADRANSGGFAGANPMKSTKSFTSAMASGRFAIAPTQVQKQLTKKKHIASSAASGAGNDGGSGRKLQKQQSVFGMLNPVRQSRRVSMRMLPQYGGSAEAAIAAAAASEHGHDHGSGNTRFGGFVNSIANTFLGSAVLSAGHGDEHNHHHQHGGQVGESMMSSAGGADGAEDFEGANPMQARHSRKTSGSATHADAAQYHTHASGDHRPHSLGRAILPISVLPPLLVGRGHSKAQHPGSNKQHQQLGRTVVSAATAHSHLQQLQQQRLHGNQAAELKHAAHQHPTHVHRPHHYHAEGADFEDSNPMARRMQLPSAAAGVAARNAAAMSEHHSTSGFAAPPPPPPILGKVAAMAAIFSGGGGQSKVVSSSAPAAPMPGRLTAAAVAAGGPGGSTASTPNTGKHVSHGRSPFKSGGQQQGPMF